MANFKLYLDEMYPDPIYKYFTLTGIAVSDQYYTSTVEPEVQRIRRNYFAAANVNLHATDIIGAKAGTPYQIFSDEATRTSFWDEISTLLRQTRNNVCVFSACVDPMKLQQYYSSSRDHYFVALQILMENFVQFLGKVKGTGDIFIESRDPSQNDKVQQHYYTLKALGTLFYDPIKLQEHLGTIKFFPKGDNIPGLEIADLITNTLNRDLSNRWQPSGGLIHEIRQSAYTGYVSPVTDRFGIKVLP